MSVHLPWGKFKGRELADVPLGYLKWMLAEHAGENWLLDAVRNEVERRGERFLPAAEILADLEESLTAAVAEDDKLSHKTAARLADHVLEVFEDVRQLHGIGSETELMVPAQREARLEIFTKKVK